MIKLVTNHYKPRNSGAYFLVVISAVLYVVSIMISGAWWCSFLFLIPLFYAALKFPITLSHGFIWGILVHASLYSFTISVLMEYGQGALRFFAYPLLVMYGAASSALWFYSAHFFVRLHCRKTIAWVISTLAYFWWVDRYFFMILGVPQGNSLFFPLLVCLHKPALLWSMYWISPYGVFFLICLGAMICALSLCRFVYYYVILASGIGLFFVGGFWLQHQEKLPLWLVNIAALQLEDDANSALGQARSMTYQMIRLRDRLPFLSCIIAPESAFPYPLNVCRQVQELWRDNVLCDDIVFCGGCYRLQDDFMYTSLCVLTHDDESWYDKEHLLYMTERVPPIGVYIAGFTKLFLSQAKPFVCGSKQRKPFAIPSIGLFVPYLCSELLLSYNQRDSYYTVPILCLANDRWFKKDYMPRLMRMQAQMKALVWKRPILYVAYRYAVWIDQYGHACAIET